MPDLLTVQRVVLALAALITLAACWRAVARSVDRPRRRDEEEA